MYQAVLVLLWWVRFSEVCLDKIWSPSLSLHLAPWTARFDEGRGDEQRDALAPRPILLSPRWRLKSLHLDPHWSRAHVGAMVQNNQESGRKYWSTRSSVWSFARTTHSFARFAHAIRCAHSFACSLTHCRARGKVNDRMSQNQAVLNHSGMVSLWLRVTQWQIVTQVDSVTHYDRGRLSDTF